MNEVYLVTGGNMGNRAWYLSHAADSIQVKCGGFIKRQSSLYETEPWGKEDQASFLNQAICIDTSFSPQKLLSVILEIEETLGRKREVRFGPRTIDIDMIFYNDEVITLPGLKVPHPQMEQRRFVLAALQEIAPDKMHPILHKSITTLIHECTDLLKVNKIT